MPGTGPTTDVPEVVDLPTPGGGGSGLRVLVVTVVHDPEDARIRHRQLRALLEAGADVAYAAPFSAYNRAVPPGVRGIDLPRAVGVTRAAALRAATQLLRTIPERFDIVLVHDPELLVAVGRARAALRETVVVWDVHEDTAAALRMKDWVPRPALKVLPAAVRSAERWAERHMRLLLAEDSYADRFSEPHPVVPNSVLVPREEPAPAGSSRVVYIGRLTTARGALDMIEMAKRVRAAAGDAIRVEVVGNADSDVRTQLTEAAQDGTITWHGFLPNTQALRHLDGALTGLSLLHDEPNYAHSRPTKVMEYMAYGVPVVTTPNPASAELVERYGSGLVVPFEDPAAAAEAILTLHRDEQLRRRMARNGREAACAHFDWARDGRTFVATLAAWAAAGRTA